MHKRIGLVVAMLLIVAMIVLPITGLADAGGFGGGSDFGGDWGGSSDWGDSDWGDSDWDSSYSGSGSSGSSGVYDLSDVVVIAIIFVVIVIVALKGKNNKGNSANRRTNMPGGQTAAMNTASLAVLREKDPAFSEAMLTEKLANIYVRLQESWEAKKLDPMRPYLADGLYNQLRNQLDEYIRNGITNKVDNIAVLSVVLTSYSATPELDILTARLRTRINDYNVKDDTGEVVSGDPKKDIFLEYEWTVIRKAGVLTQVQTKDTKAASCPKCGAPLDLNYSSQCEYCGSVVTASEFDWVVSSIKGISKRTAN